MGGLRDHLPAIGMESLQFVSATIALLSRAALVKGMSPRVYIFYRQVIATLFISPIAYFSRGKTSRPTIGMRTLLLIFATALIGVTFTQNVYAEGLYLASSSIATAMSNLIPAFTFLIAVFFRMEQVNVKKLSTIAKIVGTIVCVGGAICMALLRGPKLLNESPQLPPANSLLLQSLRVLGLGGESTWLLGCLFLFASNCSWSFWLILQVPINACYPDHLSLSAWMCFFSAMQAGVVALFLERDPSAWNLTSILELSTCFYAGVFGSSIQFFIQSWCISRRGPLFAAMFNPLATVITTVLASLFLHEEIYTGSLLGSVGVIIGLYIVLWGKAEEMRTKVAANTTESSPSQIAQEKTNSNAADLEQPLLIDTSDKRGNC